MPLVFPYSSLQPCNMRAYYERMLLTGTKPHSQSLVREDGKGTEGKYWTWEPRPPPRPAGITPILHILSWLLSINHLTLMSYTADSLSAIRITDPAVQVTRMA